MSELKIWWAMGNLHNFKTPTKCRLIIEQQKQGPLWRSGLVDTILSREQGGRCRCWHILKSCAIWNKKKKPTKITTESLLWHSCQGWLRCNSRLQDQSRAMTNLFANPLWTLRTRSVSGTFCLLYWALGSYFWLPSKPFPQMFHGNLTLNVKIIFSYFQAFSLSNFPVSLWPGLKPQLSILLPYSFNNALVFNGYSYFPFPGPGLLALRLSPSQFWTTLIASPLIGLPLSIFSLFIHPIIVGRPVFLKYPLNHATSLHPAVRWFPSDERCQPPSRPDIHCPSFYVPDDPPCQAYLTFR